MRITSIGNFSVKAPLGQAKEYSDALQEQSVFYVFKPEAVHILYLALVGETSYPDSYDSNNNNVYNTDIRNST